MKKLFLALCAVLGLLSASAQTFPARTWNDGIHILPLPAHVQVLNGTYTLPANTVLSANTPEARAVARFFADKMAASTGQAFRVADRGGNIQVQVNSGLSMNAEGYHLTVASGGVKLEAKTPQGAFYGMETLLQLLPAEIESPAVVKDISWSLPAVEITDAPSYGYRGFHLDPCRHFFTVEETKKIIDALSLFKINRMHWHLTEDQGWRIEIKKYPRLTEIGSKRTEGDGKEYGGYYTQEEIKEIVKYAADRYIEIIPEIDLPGHMAAAIAAYPELSCHNSRITPRIVWGIEDVVMCPGKEDMFTFLEQVFDEVAPLFPSSYFHVGGDECPKDQWKNCPFCQSRIQAEGIKAENGHTAEQGLQTYVLNRVEKMLAKHGKKVIGWDEILEGGLSPEATVMSWRGPKGGLAAALQGHDAIMTPSSEGLYLDYYQGDSKIEPVAIGGFAPLSKVYQYNPTPDTLKVLGLDKHIIGVQGNTWTEYIRTPEVLEYRMFPRLLAVAETGWTAPERKNYEDFEHRLVNARVRLDMHGINYYIPQPEQPGGSCNFVAFTDKAVLEFATNYPKHTLIYTLDGSDPQPGSPVYTQPIGLTQSTTLKICTLLPQGKTSPVRTIRVEKQKLTPAVTVSPSNPGLRMKKTYGYYLNPKALEKAAEWQELIIPGTREITSQEPTTDSMRGVKFYSAVAEGYVNIPEDGVYYFSSNNDEVWLDGELLISNADQLKKFSRNDRSKALAKGWHPVRIVFCGNIQDGWPSPWNDGSVSVRKSGESQFSPLKEWAYSPWN